MSDAWKRFLDARNDSPEKKRAALESYLEEFSSGKPSIAFDRLARHLDGQESQIEQQVQEQWETVDVAELDFAGDRKRPITPLPSADLQNEILQRLHDKESGGRMALREIDHWFRYKIAGLVRFHHPHFPASALADLWHDLLFTVFRKSQRGTLPTNRLLAEILVEFAGWCGYDRTKRTVYRWHDSISPFDDSTLGRAFWHKWSVLGDVQKDEMLDLIRCTINRLDSRKRAVWHAYRKAAMKKSHFPSVGQLAMSVEALTDSGQFESSIERILVEGREETLMALQWQGFDIFEEVNKLLADNALAGSGPHVPAAISGSREEDELAAETYDYLDRFIVEAFRSDFSDAVGPPAMLADAETHLTGEDIDYLNDMRENLAESICYEYREFHAWGSTVWSERRAATQTYMRQTTEPADKHESFCTLDELVDGYSRLLDGKRLAWAPNYRLVTLLGEGGQGVVYLVRSPGSDGFTKLHALKVFNPVPFGGSDHYVGDTRRMAQMAAKVSNIGSENMVGVDDFREQDGVRMMLMEWVDGFDLERLLVPEMLQRLERKLAPDMYAYLTEVVVRNGENGAPNPKIRPAVAVPVIRRVLTVLEQLHAAGMVHGDIKMSNIMLQRSGCVKLIDIGSIFPFKETEKPYHYTLRYAAPEVLERNCYSPQSDLASIGYVLIELLSGHKLFDDVASREELIEAKKALPDRLTDILPKEVCEFGTLVSLCRTLIEPDLRRRFRSANTADTESRIGALRVVQLLAAGDYGMAHRPTIREWLKRLDEAASVN